jgi:hypothetical protein
MKRHPSKKDIFIGYKSYDVDKNNKVIKEGYNGDNYIYNKWYEADIKYQVSTESYHKSLEQFYDPGFHIWLHQLPAMAYRSLYKVSAVVEVYFAKSDIINFGMNSHDPINQKILNSFDMADYTSYLNLKSSPCVITKRMYIPKQQPMLLRLGCANGI